MNPDIDSAAMAATFAATTPGEVEARYADWAASYDAENAASGFRLPQMCAAFFARHVPVGSAPVLDAGCGTGLAGDCLRISGYRDIVGLDLSERMLAHAERRGLYASLHRMTLGETLDFASGRFAAMIASGVFTEGHAPHASFDELIRVTRSGGCLVFSVRDDIYERHGFRERQEALEREGRWRLRELSDPFRSFTIKEPNIRARIFVYEVS